jgi:hypothetical protein
MAVKLARVEDFARALEKRAKASSPILSSLAIRNVPGFADTTITPSIGFLAICGGTGVGKTALLDLLYYALCPHPDASGKGSMRLTGAEVEVAFDFPGSNYIRALKIVDGLDESPGYPQGVTLLDLAKRATDAQSVFVNSNISVLVDGLSSYDLGESTTSLISHVCRKAYDKITVFETEGMGDEIIPFFKVISGTLCYDSRSMATGELSAIYLAWALHHVPVNSVVLIEEPEAYLPPASHAAMFSVVCQAAVTRGLCVVVTTHSATIASQLSAQNLLSIRLEGGLSVLAKTGDSKLRVLSRLGLAAQKHAVLFVEDRLAKSILDEILGVYEFAVSCNIEVVDTGGGIGTVKRAVEGIPLNLESFVFLGVLDGDARAEANNWPCIDRVEFLPFVEPAEKEFLDEIRKRPKKFAAMAGRKLDRLEEALALITGQDHHDQFSKLASRLSLMDGVMIDLSFKLWSSNQKTRSGVQRFAYGLAKKIGVTLPGQ